MRNGTQHLTNKGETALSCALPLLFIPTFLSPLFVFLLFVLFCFLQSSLLHPSTMGIFGWFRSVACSHGVISIHHKLHGYISVGEELTDLEMGTGYLETTWGRTFPETWIWAQSNHFALLKPPKRGSGPGGEGEVWAETEENVEERREDGPGAGDTSGAVSALYADHIHNHEQPVSLFLSVVRLPLPLPGWFLNLLTNLGLKDDDQSLPAFVAGFLHEKEVHTFGTHQLDHLTLDLEVVPKDDDKEIIHLGFTNAGQTRHLSVQLHKPIQINAGGRRKKDTECLKKAIAQKNRQRERLGGNLNPLEEAFLEESMKPKDGTEDLDPNSPEAIAMKKAIEEGIAAEKANTPEAKLNALYAKPIPVPAPIVASMYGPSKDGKMTKFVKESLIGGRIELQWKELLTASEYGRMSLKERKAKDWKQQIIGSDVMYANQLYRAIGKPTAMEVMGDIDWLIEQIERRNHDAQKSLVEWILVPRYAITIGIVLAFIVVAVTILQVLTSCCCGGKKKNAKKIKDQ